MDFETTITNMVETVYGYYPMNSREMRDCRSLLKKTLQEFINGCEHGEEGNN